MKTVRTSTQALLTFLITFWLVGGVAIAEPAPSLFANSTAQADSSGSHGPEVMRSRPVDINFSLLTQADPAVGAVPLNLNLFDDASLTARIDGMKSKPSGARIYTGSVEGGGPFSHVAIVANGDTVAGDIFNGHDIYQIRSLGNGLHEIRQLDSSKFPADSDPIPVYAPQGQTDSAPIANADDGSVVDVLVVYSAAARMSTSAQTVAAMEAEIDLAESLTNTSYSNSGVAHTINVVGKQEVSYTESSSTSILFSQALNDVTGTSATQDLSAVRTQRDTLGADLVVFIIKQAGSLCGIAWLMTSVSSTFETNGFSVVGQGTCATTNFSFGHEIGHNSGARHDRANDPTDNSPFTFNHGYVDSTNVFKTIMGTGSNTRIQFYSNPDVNSPAGFGSAPTGIAEGNALAADNRKTLNQTALTISNFRASVSSTSNTAIPSNLFTRPKGQRVVAPYWQADMNIYTFIAISHPSLSGMNSQIGVSVNPVLSDVSAIYGTPAEFTVLSGQTKRLFILGADNTIATSPGVSGATLITGTGTDTNQGPLIINPVASNPEKFLGIANSASRGFTDITQLSFWGAVVIPQNSTGFAMEFIGDMQDSRAFDPAGNFSGVN